jgi:serine/threonine protein kinase
MGEVYRGRDSRLGWDVALKVLPVAFAADTERMARFQREAQVLALLNHPNIASIYGLEDSGEVRALVMELVEGPTLADRIATGGIPVDEALSIAKQICEAVEYAHERGVVHRDLKPANIKLANGTSVKVLDFGLAKALEGDWSVVGYFQFADHHPACNATRISSCFVTDRVAFCNYYSHLSEIPDKIRTEAQIVVWGVSLFDIPPISRPRRGNRDADFRCSLPILVSRQTGDVAISDRVAIAPE